MTSTMKSPPGRSVVSTSIEPAGSDSRATAGAPAAADRGGTCPAAGAACTSAAAVPTMAAPVTAALWRNRRRPMEVLRMWESLNPAGGRWSVVGGRWSVVGGRGKIHEGVHRPLRSGTRMLRHQALQSMRFTKETL
jgi:hypothetical protein